jgi:predicted outer membrane repeat protein
MKQRNKYSLKQRNKYSLRWGAFLLVLVFANGAANSALVPQTTIGTWTRLNATIGAAAGKKVIITLSTPFVMGDFKRGSCINIEADNTDISIVGNGAVFDAGKTDRFFYVAPRVLSTTLVISNVTMQNGNYTYAYPPDGGAIYIFGSTLLSLTHCTFSRNTAKGYGGAIYFGGGTFTLINCTFSANSVAYGGAIYFDAGTLSLTSCIFSKNAVAEGTYQVSKGGAIYISNLAANTGAITLANCTFSENVASKGGAIFNDVACREISFQDCSFVGKQSTGHNDVFNRVNSSCALNNQIFMHQIPLTLPNGKPVDCTHVEGCGHSDCTACVRLYWSADPSTCVPGCVKQSNTCCVDKNLLLAEWSADKQQWMAEKQWLLAKVARLRRELGQ